MGFGVWGFKKMISKNIKLILASFLGLFLELVFIRWLPAHVFSIAFFSNIILIAAFLGLGLGLLITHYKRDLFKFFPSILLLFVVLTLFLRNIQINIPADAQTWIWSNYYNNRLNVYNFKISIIPLISIIFSSCVIIFIPIGQKIGKLMQGLKPLAAYTLNIVGSLLGVIFFAALSAFQLPAYIWFLTAGLIIILLTYRQQNFLWKVFFIITIIVLIGLVEKDIKWSPYYALNVKTNNDSSISVYVNQLFHQKGVNFEKEPNVYNKYKASYDWFKPKQVLIIGSGTGNDVWIARQSGAEHIDAVEIDSAILKLKHPQNPYASNQVEVFIDDARSFINKTQKKYDMVVYGTLDSHATLALTSSIRLDNYIYTKEALKEASGLLTDDGVMLLLFSVPTKWMSERLINLTRSAFETDNIRYLITDNYLFNMIIIAGPGLKNKLLENTDLNDVLLALPKRSATNPVPIDDWPYLYLTKRTIPRLYLFALLAMIVISLMALFILTPLKRNRINFLFLFLGLGFLLLETKSITTFSLLFGSTWVVNAVVFAAILAIALLANLMVMKKTLKNPNWFFAGLFLSLILLYIFPLNSLLNLNLLNKIFSAGLLVALPIFFSSLIFAILIKKIKNINIALGSNLLGAVLGGFFEYSSMLFGLNTLYIIALIFYVIAMICLIKNKIE